MNDLPKRVSVDVTLYAHDTTVVITGESYDDLHNICKLNLKELLDWFVNNKLTINLDKTKILTRIWCLLILISKTFYCKMKML